MVQHAIVTVEDRLAQWRAADSAARAAEARVRELGPGTTDVGLRDLAVELRARADRLLAAALRAVPIEGNPECESLATDEAVAGEPVRLARPWAASNPHPTAHHAPDDDVRDHGGGQADPDREAHS